MKPRLYLLWIHFCTFFAMFAIHMCEKISFFLKYLSGTMFCVCFCVCTCTNQLVLSTEVTRLNFLNSIIMGQINQCGFQSHVAIDRYCIFLEINTFELSWVELNCHPPMQIPLVCNFHGVLPNIKLPYTPLSSENTHCSTVRIQDSTSFNVEDSIMLMMGPQISLNLKSVPVGLAMYFGETWILK